MKKLIYFLTMAIAVMITACGDDDDPKPAIPSFKDVTISCGESYQIPEGSNVDWTSSNEYIATVEGTEVTAVRAGEVVISSRAGSFKLTVNPTSYAFTEPCMDWGASISDVKSWMNRLNGLTLKEEKANQLSYTGTGKYMAIVYGFEDNGLHTSSIGLNSNYLDTKAITEFLFERYVVVNVDDSDYSVMMISPDKTLGVYMSVTTVGRIVAYLLVYMPIDLSSRAASMIPDSFSTLPHSVTDESISMFKDIKNRI